MVCVRVPTLSPRPRTLPGVDALHLGREWIARALDRLEADGILPIGRDWPGRQCHDHDHDPVNWRAPYWFASTRRLVPADKESPTAPSTAFFSVMSTRVPCASLVVCWLCTPTGVLMTFRHVAAAPPECRHLARREHALALKGK